MLGGIIAEAMSQVLMAPSGRDEPHTKGLARRARQNTSRGLWNSSQYSKASSSGSIYVLVSEAPGRPYHTVHPDYQDGSDTDHTSIIRTSS